MKIFVVQILHEILIHHKEILKWHTTGIKRFEVQISIKKFKSSIKRDFSLQA